MTIILFLVDTSASMCQKAYVNGVQKSYLDIAKGAVETFLKYRQRSQDCMGDRYMLLTFEDPPANVKAGWKENHGTFMNELKNLQSNGLTSMGEALRNAFDLLNLNRMQSGIDTYGQGRCPFYLEPSVIIVITDGGKYSFKNGVHQEIILPLNPQTTGAKLTKEPFRWDQRLFSLVLRMAGNRVDERLEGKVPHDDSPIEKMCEVTGGRSYRVRSHYVLNQCIESLVQKVQPGVVVHFEPMMPKDPKDVDPQDIAFGITKKMIYVQKHPTQKTFPLGFWPIPEPYWPDSKATILPPRDAHPRIRIVTPSVQEPALVHNFPVDKYEVEPSPLTLQILSKRESTRCWPVFVANGIHGMELPFGYLKANQNFTQVHLVILPYNYLVLLPLLADLFQKFGLNPPSEWVYKFSTYIRSIPQYYGPFLRRALASASVPFQLLQYILPENLDSYLSPTVANYLKTMKTNAKQEQETMCMRVFKQLKLPKPTFHQVEMAKLNTGCPLKRDLVSHPQLKETFAKLHTEISEFEQYTIVVPSVQQQPSAKNYQNPFLVPRRDLIDEIARMRENFLKLPTHGITIFTKDAGHSLPISEMGNYQEYLKNKQSPLREIEPTNVRQHMFGNPYKKDKHMVMVDEADVGEVAPLKMAGGGGGGGGAGGTGGVGIVAGMAGQSKKDASRVRKRKAGPIHRDYVFKRKFSGGDSDSECGDSIGYCRSMGSSMLDTDTEDEDVSVRSQDSGSVIGSDDDEHDLVIDFPEDPMEDFFDSGHVQKFINEDTEEFSVKTEPTMILPVVAPAVPAILNNFSVAQAPDQPLPSLAVLFPPTPIHVTPNNHVPTLPPLIIPTPASVIPPPLLASLPTSTPSSSNGIPAALAQSPSSPLALHTTTITTTTPPPPPAIIAHVSLPTSNGPTHNDYDAQEISKILQQCTNGMDQSRHHFNQSPLTNSSNSFLDDNALDDSNSTDNDDPQEKPITPSSNNHRQHKADKNTSADTTNSGGKRKFPAAKRSTSSNNTNHNNSSNNSNNKHSKDTDNHSTDSSFTSSSSASSQSNDASTTNSHDYPDNDDHPANENNDDHHQRHHHHHHHQQQQQPSLDRNNDHNHDDNDDDDQKENVKMSNREARGVIFKDIRRPGRDYSLLLDHLSLVRGSLETRFTFVQMCIGESMRFRRKKMAETIREWWDRQIDLT